jgi:hypothetical protein
MAIVHPSSVLPSAPTRVVGANAIARAPVALTMTVSPVMKSWGAGPLMPPCYDVVAGQLQAARADALSGDLIVHSVVAVRVRAHGHYERVVFLLH